MVTTQKYHSIPLKMCTMQISGMPKIWMVTVLGYLHLSKLNVDAKLTSKLVLRWTNHKTSRANQWKTFIAIYSLLKWRKSLSRNTKSNTFRSDKNNFFWQTFFSLCPWQCSRFALFKLNLVNNSSFIQRPDYFSKVRTFLWLYLKHFKTCFKKVWWEKFFHTSLSGFDGFFVNGKQADYFFTFSKFCHVSLSKIHKNLNLKR